MAYAAITSLMSTVSLLLEQKALHVTGESKELMKVLYGKLESLTTLVEETDKSIRDHQALKTLEAQTTDTAYMAEDMVESVLREFARGRSICECLQKVIENVDSTAEEWMKMNTIYGKIKDLEPQTFDLGDSSQHVLESKNIMVGYDDELEVMLNQLVRGLGEDKVISLVGMGGIGKTTFATRIFNEAQIMSHFDVRAKITVSQEYHVRHLYLGLLRYTSSRSEGLDEKDDGELADLLQKSLKVRRYLVIVDDICTTDAWDDIRMCFPFNNNGSRILLTTRDTEVAEYASSGVPPYQMRLLTFDESWNLLCQKVSKNESLTREFETIGKEIARKCQGLPLATVVMGGVLLKIGKSLVEWNKVVEDTNLLMTTDLDHYCTRVLAFSYYRLPHHLRACLLYMVVSKKSSEIPVSKILRLWAAEGFMKVKTGESIEMAAEKCLKDLIGRSLVSVRTWSSYGKMKTCGIHDMIHGFCLEEVQNTYFFNVIMEKDVQLQHWCVVVRPSHERRLSIQSSKMPEIFAVDDDTVTRVSSIIFSSRYNCCRDPAFSCFSMLRVLDISSVTFDFKPKSIGDLFCLRYLAFTITRASHIPVIANLKSLQSLIIQCLQPIYGPLSLPREVWGMSQLRYLKSALNYLPSPPEIEPLVLEHLHTLSGLNPTSYSPPVGIAISNVKKLQICGTKTDYTFNRLGSFQSFNLIHLHQLESLSVVVKKITYGYDKIVSPIHLPTQRDLAFRLPPASAFPRNLKKLSLQRTFLSWKEMTATVGLLPKLEFLKLKNDACRGTEWETIDDGFPQLKFLLLDGTGLTFWKTSSDHFPCLERLVLRDCYLLISIPEDFADVMTLQLIELSMCNPSVVHSAKQIQQEVGDNVLDVHVRNPIYRDAVRGIDHHLRKEEKGAEEEEAEKQDIVAEEEEEAEKQHKVAEEEEEKNALQREEEEEDNEDEDSENNRFNTCNFEMRRIWRRIWKETKEQEVEGRSKEKKDPKGGKIRQLFSFSSLRARFLEWRIQTKRKL